MGSRNRDDGLVYSSEHGTMCPECNKKFKACTCSKQAKTPTGDGIVRVGRETKGRKGKGVTIITGILLDEKELKALETTLNNLHLNIETTLIQRLKKGADRSNPIFLLRQIFVIKTWRQWQACDQIPLIRQPGETRA